MRAPSLSLALAALAAGLPLAGWAQSVSLQGVIGNSRAVLVVNGGVKAVAVGDSFQDVKVISASGDSAVVEIDGKRQTLSLGAAQVSVVARPAARGASGAAAAQRIVLSASGGGHFQVSGSINGQYARFMVDTGASMVAMGSNDAQRLGINYTEGRPTRTSTANGTGLAWMVKLGQIKINEVEVLDIDALVTQQPMPYVLLGNSFLNRFTLQRDADQMVLEKRY